MQLELPRTGLNGSALVELLAQLALADRPAAAPSFVEGIARWLGWKEAIALSTVLQAPPQGGRHSASPGPASAVDSAALAGLEAEFSRVHTALTLAIDRALEEASASATATASADESPVVSARKNAHDFLPWRRCCFGLQQAMEAAVSALRAQARAVLQRSAATHPELATLAALDTTLAAVLAPRELAQLALMPVLLERHFMRPEARQNGAPGAFKDDMRRLLCAELELRLQPALGLLDALRATHTGSA